MPYSTCCEARFCREVLPSQKGFSEFARSLKPFYFLLICRQALVRSLLALKLLTPYGNIRNSIYTTSRLRKLALASYDTDRMATSGGNVAWRGNCQQRILSCADQFYYATTTLDQEVTAGFAWYIVVVKSDDMI